jgi:hypothetical protein
MLSFMTLRRLPQFAAASVLLALTLAGCSEPHDLSVTESCKQWKQLKRGAWTDEVKDDLRAAAPRMHEAVAKQVLIAVEVIPSDGDKSEMSDEQIDAGLASYQRLYDLCGGL